MEEGRKVNHWLHKLEAVEAALEDKRDVTVVMFPVLEAPS